MVKVLSVKFEMLTDKLNFHSQSTFLKGRLLDERVMVVNEVIEYSQSTKKHYLIFKVNFEKAYNRFKFYGLYTYQIWV